ncbi:MAG: substrate-binding domain-containing protein [Clostridiales bacterium]|jgi:ABC-type sugar transport system substrate-binding protein|nr:substrate-binding domain-containing protein [Clostridiales bacterium]
MMKKSVALLMLLAMVFMVACSGQTTPPEPAASAAPAEPDEPAAPAEPETAPEDGKKGTIAVVCYVTSAPYFAFGEKQAIATGEALGYDVIWTGTPEVDTPGLIDIITNLIEQDVDAICLASGDTTSVVPICQEAMSKGIKVVSFDLDIAPEGRDVYAGLMDLAELGIPQVESIVDSIGTEGKYAIMTGVLTNEFLQSRIDLCLNYAKEKYPGLECVTIEAMDEDPEKAYNVTMDILNTYPDVKAIMSNVSTALGPIATAIEDAGKIGEVYACGQSSPNLAKPGMASGAVVSAILWDTAKWQSWAITIAANLIEGKDMPVGKISIDGFPDAERFTEDVFYYYETFTFTPENINNYDF